LAARLVYWLIGVPWLLLQWIREIFEMAKEKFSCR